MLQCIDITETTERCDPQSHEDSIGSVSVYFYPGLSPYRPPEKSVAMQKARTWLWVAEVAPKVKVVLEVVRKAE